MSPYLQTAIEAAEAAEAIIKRYYRGDFAVQLKPDQSPVTIADVESERAIKEVLSARFPEHGYWGEETGKTREDAEHLWLIDPIDGTQSFVRGYPFFSTQIALSKQREVIMGVSNAPVFGELAYAERGQGAFLNSERVAVSDITELERATISCANITSLAATRKWQGLGEIVQRVDRIRGYGDFYQYHLLAAGKIEIVLESDVNILDIAALSIIVREAGGVFTDLEGKPIDLRTTSVLAANNLKLHQRVMNILDSQ